MPLQIAELLQPIPGDNPGGADVRYEPVYDQIKRARIEEADLPTGDWSRERKTADFALVIKHATDVLTKKSKDLQVAAWLTEALLSAEGFGGLNAGLTLIRGLIEGFWDTVYPELEDGEAESRAAPIDWVGGTYLTIATRKVPLTKAGYNWIKYQEARSVGREAPPPSGGRGATTRAAP